MTYEEYLTNKYAYQEDGYRLLTEMKHACLFYMPGKGKTYPCIDALRDVALNGKVLILSTADAIRNMWEIDIVPQNILPKNTELMTFGKAIQDTTRLRLLKSKYDVIIVDESHKIKSHNAKISKLVHMLTKKCEYAWGLTGTPRGNSDLDIFCQFHNLNISMFGDISYSRFIDQCCDVEKQFFGARMITRPIGINREYIGGWQRNIAMYSQRVEYTEEDNMPDLNEHIVNLPYTKSDEYKLAEKGVINIPDYSTTMNKMTAIQKMHQSVNGFLYKEDKSIYRFEHNIKLDWLKANLTDKPTVIVYRHIADLDDLRANFIATENIGDFKAGTCNLLLLQCSRCESFNLQMCNNIIFYTLDYSFIKYCQMIHRCWRKEQFEDVNITILMFKDTVENQIWNSVKNKKKLSELFMSIKEAS